MAPHSIGLTIYNLPLQFVDNISKFSPSGLPPISQRPKEPFYVLLPVIEVILAFLSFYGQLLIARSLSCRPISVTLMLCACIFSTWIIYVQSLNNLNEWRVLIKGFPFFLHLQTNRVVSSMPTAETMFFYSTSRNAVIAIERVRLNTQK